MEDENRRLQHLVADLGLNQEVLKPVIRKNGWSLPGWEKMSRSLRGSSS